jgi:sugar lactone lactonase YvrE
MKTLRLAGAVLAAGLLAGMPLAAQSTNVGSIKVGSSSASPVAVRLTIETSGTLGSIAVLTQGAANLDFTNAGGGTCTVNKAYTADETCTVKVTFKPKHPGPRYGGVELLDGSGNLLASGYVQGTGVGPQATFANTTSGVYLPSAQISLCCGSSFALGGVAVDASGDVFVGDVSGNSGQVKEIMAVDGSIPASPTIKTLGSYSPLDPLGVAVDGMGNVFVSDGSDGYAVKEIVAAGGYTTVNTLGSGVYQPWGVAVDGSGNVFVADHGNDAVWEIPASCIAGANNSTCMFKLGSGFSDPTALAVDGDGNVFVVDVEWVKEILAAGGYTTVETTPGSGFNGLGDVAVDASGDVFVGDRVSGNSGQVKEIMAVDGSIPASPTIKTLGSGFRNPQGVTIDGSGNVFVGDFGAHVVWELDYADPPSLTFAPTLPGQTSTDSPQTVTVSNDGNADLTFTALSYPTDFPEASGDSNSCTGSTSLAAGQACDLPIEFSPEKTGSPLSEAVTLTDNALNVTGTQKSIAASGVGASLATLTPSSGTLEASQTFTWNNGTPATQYQLLVGTTRAGSSNLYDSLATTATTATVSIPQNGVDVYARLWSDINGVWQHTDYTFTESGAPVASVLNTPSPAPNPTLGTSETFTWTAGGGVTEYELELGTTKPGSSNLYDSEHTTALTSPVVTIPSYGFTVYARLFSYINRVWQHTDYTFTESGAAVASVLNTPSPAPNPTLGTSETFTWTAGGGVTEYELDLGTGGPGKSNLYNSGHTTALTSPVVAIPSKGSVVYARLWSYINKVWQHTDYTFTEP